MAKLLNGVPIEHEPKRTNRFIMRFPEELGLESWLVETSGRPTATIKTVNVEEMNTTNYVTGKVSWGTIDIKTKDLISLSSTQKLWEWLNLHHEVVSGRAGYAAGYKKTIELTGLDPVGVAVESWLLLQCQLTKVNFGDQNQLGTDNLQFVGFTVQPYQCILQY
jgi:hypothetical protein